jgi:hypothetical protein
MLPWSRRRNFLVTAAASDDVDALQHFRPPRGCFDLTPIIRAAARLGSLAGLYEIKSWVHGDILTAGHLYEAGLKEAIKSGQMPAMITLISCLCELESLDLERIRQRAVYWAEISSNNPASTLLQQWKTEVSDNFLPV